MDYANMTLSGEFKPISIENLNLGSAGDFSGFFQIYMAINEKPLTECEFEFKPTSHVIRNSGAFGNSCSRYYRT
jgi:hypothetical protein